MKVGNMRPPASVAMLAEKFEKLATRYEDFRKSAESLDGMRRNVGTILPISAGTFLLDALDRGLFAKTVRPVWDLRDYWREQLERSVNEIPRFVEEPHANLADPAKSGSDSDDPAPGYGDLSTHLLKTLYGRAGIANDLNDIIERAMKLLERRDPQSEVETKERELLSIMSWFVYLRLELIPENAVEFRADWPDVIPVVFVPRSSGEKIIGKSPSGQLSWGGLPGKTKNDKRRFQVLASADIQATACHHVAKWLREMSSKTQSGGKKTRRRRRSPLQPKRLTAKQIEASKLHGECNGNIAEVARRMRIDRSTAKQHIVAAFTKLGRSVPTKPKTTKLKTDRRGQSDVTKSDDHRE